MDLCEKVLSRPDGHDGQAGGIKLGIKPPELGNNIYLIRKQKEILQELFVAYSLGHELPTAFD